MTDRFDLEQQILDCWRITDEVKLLNKNVLEGKIGGGTMTQDEISNFLLGLETIYDLKFNELFDTFSKLVHDGKLM
jgi:hypothetical protein